MVWKPASPSPGMLVWTGSTLGSASRIVSAWIARSRTASDEAPAGGATVTATSSRTRVDERVGQSWAISEPVTKNRTMAAPTTPSFVQRLRSAHVIAGV